MKIINNNKDCQSEIFDEFGFIFPKIWNVIGLQTTDVQWYLTWLLLFQILFNSILPNLLTFISNNKTNYSSNYLFWLLIPYILNNKYQVYLYKLTNIP